MSECLASPRSSNSTPKPTPLSESLDSIPVWPSESIIQALSSLLAEMCEKNDVALSTAPEPTRLTKFHSVVKPNIPIFEYLNRIRRYSTCSDSCFIIAIIYLDLAQHRSGLVVDSLNVHRLLITAIMLASKFFDDKCQRNLVYAQIGGLAVMELNQLEIELLNALTFTLDILPTQFAIYQKALMTRFAPTASPTSSTSPSTTSTSSMGSPLTHSRSSLRMSTSSIQLVASPISESDCSQGEESHSDVISPASSSCNASSPLGNGCALKESTSLTRQTLNLCL